MNLESLSETQREYIQKCRITPIQIDHKGRVRYIVLTPLGFHAGSYEVFEKAEQKVLSMAKSH